MANTNTLLELLKDQSSFKKIMDEDTLKKEIEKMQLKMLRVQQGVWHKKSRVIIMFEGFDASGKGGTIRKLTEKLDPRSFKVHPIAAPSQEEQGKHWLYRFWSLLPSPGDIAIFDRSWYGRVLVERVEELTKKENWNRAFTEIVEFERMLTNDGIHLIKIFMALGKDEQYKRFEQRLEDPYKQWKLTDADILARKKWDKYVEAMQDIFAKTHSVEHPWHIVPANYKHYARHNVLKIVTGELKSSIDWIEKKVLEQNKKDLKAQLKQLI